MPFFAWEQRFELGIEAIDADHRRLFDLLRRLHDGVAAGWGPPAVGEALREIEDHSRSHFQREEELLDVAGCPELARQRGEHGSFLEHLADLEGSGPAVSVQTVERLRDYLLEHVLGSDRGYAGWLARAAPEAVAAWARKRAVAAIPQA